MIIPVYEYQYARVSEMRVFFCITLHYSTAEQGLKYFVSAAGFIQIVYASTMWVTTA